MDFREDYPSAQIIKLEQNYRSTQTILNAANAVIKNNVERLEKRLWTENNPGVHLQKYAASDEHNEADFIVESMMKEHGENHVPYGKMAVLYRMNAQSRVIEEGMVKRGIAYTMVGGTRFYDRAEIRDMLAYLKLVANFRDDISLMRIINVPRRGIGQTTIQKLSEFSKQGNMSMFEGIMSLEESDIPVLARTKLQKFSALIFSFLNASTEGDVFTLIQKIMTDTEYLSVLQQSSDPQAQSREENLGELLNVAKDFIQEQPEGGLPEFLEKVALVNDVDSFEEQDDKVTLMTIHSAKGLEFPIVYMAGMDEGIFPGVRSLMDETALEEERRLCYVAITRAKEKLYLTTSAVRTMYGQVKPYVESRFLKEIPVDLLDEIRGNSSEAKRRTLIRSNNEQKSKWALSSAGIVNKPVAKKSVKARFDWQVGDKVSHRMWGKGQVAEVTGSGKHMMLKLIFPNDQIRQVMVAFAPIEKEE